MAWRLVEVEVQGGRQLVLDPGGPTALGRLRIEARVDRERATPGEVVEAEIWLEGAVGPHLLEARPGRPGVRIIGPSAFRVEGEERATVRFTSDAPGRSGIEVSVREDEN